MAPFPYLAMLAIMACLVSSMVVQMSVFAYAGYMVEHLGVVDNKDESGDEKNRDSTCLNTQRKTPDICEKQVDKKGMLTVAKVYAEEIRDRTY